MRISHNDHAQPTETCTVTQIRFFILQNRAGKTRLSKWYVDIEEDEKRKIEAEAHRMVTLRDNKYTNFVEVRIMEAGSHTSRREHPGEFTTPKLHKLCCLLCTSHH